jgi:hypothetical protein
MAHLHRPKLQKQNKLLRTRKMGEFKCMFKLKLQFSKGTKAVFFGLAIAKKAK